MDVEDIGLKITIEEFLAKSQPGTSLEIPNVGRLEHLPGRRLTYFKYRTGELRVWEIPDPQELSVIEMVQACLVKVLS
jgi:hypothetical protein